MSNEVAAVPTSPRRDAVRNRAHILEVAHELLSADPLASLNEIAKRAKVGTGTLYRHFPSREDLILAVYHHDVQKLVDSVDDVLAANSPIDAFITWFETLAAYIRVKHGLGEALHSAAAQDAINETYAPVIGAVQRLLDACTGDGSLRPDLDPSDVLLLMGFLWRLPPGDEGSEQGERITGLVLDGLRQPA
jgi:AcrR family transcriptional regulator